MYGVKKISQSGIEEAVTKEDVKLCFDGEVVHEGDNLIFGTNEMSKAVIVRDAVAFHMNKNQTFDKIVDVQVYEFQ